MKKIAFVFVAAMTVLSFAGCKKKDDAGALLKSEEAFKTEMCACKDKACADSVAKKKQDYQAEMAKKPASKEPAKRDEAMEKKFAEITKAYTDCVAKHAAPPPGPGSDSPGSAAVTPPADPPPAGSGSAAAPAGSGSAAAPAGSAK